MKRKNRYFLAAMLLWLPLVSGCSAGSFETEPVSQYDITSASQQNTKPAGQGDAASSVPQETKPAGQGDAASSAPQETKPSGQGDAASSVSQETKPTGQKETSSSAPQDADIPAWQGRIPFGENQWYAVAYLGYQQMDGLDYYMEQYLGDDQLPTYCISEGDFYLVIPRYAHMSLSLFAMDMETSEERLFTEVSDCGPFILQCNVSDVFVDASVRLSLDGTTVEFSPFLSLKDGTLDAGEYGLDLTREGILPTGGEPEGAGDDLPSVDENVYIGEYMASGMEEAGLEIACGENGQYVVQISIFRLTALTDGVGELTEEGITFEATDAAGNPIRGIVSVEGETATVTFTDSTWEYLPNGTEYQYFKSADIPNLWD